NVVLTVVRNKQPTKITMTTGTFSETTTPTAGPAGRRLGLAVQALTPELRQELKLPDSARDGVVVTSVQTGTPADAAGFQQGDVIVRVNDTAIHTMEDYTGAMAKARPGDSVGFRIFRQAQTEFVVLQIPDAGTAPGNH
ncbi:MAG: PDZ domain-containing protein, partial [Chloroflexi bacterium]|nr:PDZ domain-containing protein [Chloroflexota bacterium]